MTTNTGEPANAHNIAERRLSIDAEALANLFSKLKENDNIDENVELIVDREPKDIPKPELKDFADQMIYFRKLKGYTQRQAGEKIGVSEDTYRRYELREVEIIDLKKIDRIVKALDFTEKPKVSEYVEFLMSNPEKMLVKFFKESGISKNAFAKRAGFNRRSILEWINKEKSISEESYYKIKRFMQEYEKENINQIEDEEME